MAGPVPQDALDYFRAKDLRVGFSFEDVWGQEHAHAVTVAKAMQLDVLDDIRGAVDQALAEGKTYRDFARDLKPVLQSKGWWGRKHMVDPETGEQRDVQLGSPRRLKTIYQANLRSARAAGQWQRIQRRKRSHPYLLYLLGPSEQHREEHVGWAGILLPVDHPWWQTHMPQNGWGCKCHVRQVSRAEYERLVSDGFQDPDAPAVINPDTGLPTGRRVRRRIPVRTEPPPYRPRRFVNKRTGETTEVDAGLDPAWSHNAGQDRVRVIRESLVGKVDSADQALARASVRQVVDSPVLDDWMREPQGELPVGILGRDMQSALGSGSQVVRLSVDTLDKQSRSHAELTADHYRLLPALIEGGTAVRQGDRRLAMFQKVNGRWHKAVVKTDADGRKIYLVSYHLAKFREVQREVQRGQLLRGLPQP